MWEVTGKKNPLGLGHKIRKCHSNTENCEVLISVNKIDTAVVICSGEYWVMGWSYQESSKDAVSLVKSLDILVHLVGALMK